MKRRKTLMGSQFRRFEKLEKRKSQESSSKVGTLSFPIWKALYECPFPTSYALAAGGRKNDGFSLHLLESEKGLEQLPKHIYRYVTQRYPEWFDQVFM
jgi:hypothetical protein